MKKSSATLDSSFNRKSGEGQTVFLLYSFKVLNWLASGVLLVMVFLTTAHVFSRWLLGRPFLGTPEYLEFLNVALVSCAILCAHVTKSHLSVDFLVVRFPKRMQAITDNFISCLSSVLCSLTAWKNFELAEEMRQSSEVSLTLGISYYPFIYGIGLCFALWAVLFLIDLWKSIKS